MFNVLEYINELMDNGMSEEAAYDECASRIEAENPSKHHIEREYNDYEVWEDDYQAQAEEMQERIAYGREEGGEY